MTQLRSFSYGGGVQSTAALILAKRREIDFKLFLFSNVGENSEHPATLKYVREIAMPYATQHGLDLRELGHKRRDGNEHSLYNNLMRDEIRFIDIPMYQPKGGYGRRSCTSNFKIRRIAIALRRLGATKDNPAVVGMGISLDEFERVKVNSSQPDQVLEYPLIDLRLTRSDCVKIIEAEGLPIPPKSSCWFCPFHGMPAWQALHRDYPDLFQKAVELEDRLSTRSAELGKGKLYLSYKKVPLEDAINNQRDMFADDDLGMCEAGYCHT